MQILVIILIILVGLACGSFLNVCISRIPLRQSIIMPSSYCLSCGRKISPLDNIPLFSFLFLRGKCRYCHTAIAWHHPVVELVTPLFFLTVYFQAGFHLNLLFFKYVLFISGSIIIFFTDLSYRIVPDVVSLPMILCGIVFSILPGSDVTLFSSLLGAASGFFLFLFIAVIYNRLLKREGLGGGDIKLIAAIGSFLGLQGVFFTILVSSVMALIILILFRYDKTREFAYGPFLVAGSFFYILSGKLLFKLYTSLFI
ncbi:MAG: prepilin peptidase [Candidatus Cloacimonetes bacterium]|nr:prepilin peptidase [Candidatus Cloacimonadota bacterium]